MKTYKKTHTQKVAFDNHLAKIKRAGAKVSTKGLTITYTYGSSIPETKPTAPSTVKAKPAVSKPSATATETLSSLPKDNKINSWNQFVDVMSRLKKLTRTQKEWIDYLRENYSGSMRNYFSIFRVKMAKISDQTWMQWQTSMNYKEMAKVSYESYYDQF